MFDFPFIAVSEQDQRLTDSVIEKVLAHERAGKRRIPKNDQRFLPVEIAETDGMRGECASARYLGLRWKLAEVGWSEWSAGDLGYGIEVKSTSKPNGNLYCSSKTHADYMRRNMNTIVMLARVDAWPWVEFPGWILAKDLPRYPFTPTNARHNSGFLVPVEKLQPIDSLAQWCFDRLKHEQEMML